MHEQQYVTGGNVTPTPGAAAQVATPRYPRAALACSALSVINAVASIILGTHFLAARDHMSFIYTIVALAIFTGCAIATGMLTKK